MKKWMASPLEIVSIYFPTAANNPNPDIDTDFVISPNTPSGAKRIIIPVIFIITSKKAVKKFRKNSECFLLILVKPIPRNMAKKIIPSISPDEAAWNGFNGIIRINISAGDPGFCKFEWSKEFCVPRSIPIPGCKIFVRVKPINIANKLVTR